MELGAQPTALMPAGTIHFEKRLNWEDHPESTGGRSVGLDLKEAGLNTYKYATSARGNHKSPTRAS